MSDFETSKEMVTTINVPETLLVGEPPHVLDKVIVTTYVDEAGTEWPSNVRYVGHLYGWLHPTQEERRLFEDFFVDLAMEA